MEEIEYGTSKIQFLLEYANRKSLGIKVYPNSSVRVIAPLGADLMKIKEKVKSKAAWIIKKQAFFLAFFPLTPPRRFISGETHLYLGKQYRLKLIEADNESVKLQAGDINISIKDKTNKKHIESLLKAWYKSKAEIHFNKLFEECIPMAKTFYDSTPSLKYRWMDKRWGSCDKNGTIHLNLELIKASKKSIEYVIIHELCHLVHLNHSSAFYDLLNKFSPNWKRIKDDLERMMV